MGFAIKGYQDNLRRQIEDYTATLNIIQNNNPVNNVNSPSMNAFGGTGVSASAIKDAKATDVFSAAKKYGGNQTTASQSNINQTAMANSTTAFNEMAIQIKTKAVNTFTAIINSLESQLQSLGADKSPVETPKTTGQSIRAEENIPTDNQGTENKAGTAKDSQKPNVGFGEETVEDKSKTDNNDDNKKVDKQERESSTQQAQTSEELDKAAQKESLKQFQEAQQKLQQEAAKLREAATATA